MKTQLKRLLSVCMVLALVITMLPIQTAQAAKKTNVSLLP